MEIGTGYIDRDFSNQKMSRMKWPVQAGLRA
jgi:hypothetical protein